MVTFYEWLKKQCRRDDPIGDFAKDAIDEDLNFPAEATDQDVIKKYLLDFYYYGRRQSACAEALQAFDEAWLEFETKKKQRAPISLKLRFEIFRRDGFACRLCGFGVADGCKLEIDHKKPFSGGGRNEPSNLWTLCFACNRGKGSQSL